MKDFLTAPWPWYIGGPMITFVMVLMLFFGQRFGISSTLRTICSMGGAKRFSEYFDIPWKTAIWNVVFAVGAIIGGYLAATYMTPEYVIELNPETKAALIQSGIAQPGKTFLPESIFSWDNLGTLQGFVFMVVGGFLVGFGTRYAEGCTSGHAISGLSNLQPSSLIATIGFFIGGLIVTHFLLPVLL